LPVFDWLYIRKELVICDWLLVICDFSGIRIRELQFGLCLLIILEARIVPAVFVESLLKENRETACIPGASVRTAQAKATRINKQ
jgi:hypothetical protein